MAIEAAKPVLRIQPQNQVGLREDEDLFTPVWHGARNRWAWLGLNLTTAFIASRVIGMFEVIRSWAAACC